MTASSPTASRPAEQVSPDELLGGFSHGHLVRWFLAALLIHGLLIGGFSVGTIRDWLDPEGAQARKAAAVAAAQAATATATAPPAEPRPADAAAGAATADARQAGDAKPAEAKTPIEKATSEAAQPSEIPNAPDDLGLSIEDTNPQ